MLNDGDDTIQLHAQTDRQLPINEWQLGGWLHQAVGIDAPKANWLHHVALSMRTKGDAPTREALTDCESGQSYVQFARYQSADLSLNRTD